MRRINGMADIKKSEKSRTWRRRTQMIRGGLERSGFDETCEALYLTSGYVYDRAEVAQAAFK